MNCIVCVKFVPPAEAEPVMDENHIMKRDGLVLELNPADESALELALRLRGDGKVTVVTMGGRRLEGGLRSLLALGVDECVLITDPAFAGADTYATAQTLRAVAGMLGVFDLLLCGRRAIDGETGQVPAELASLLGLPCVTNVTKAANAAMVTNVTKVYQEGDNLLCHRLLESGTEALEVSLPAVLSLCEYSYRLRLPGLRGMREARNKTVRILTNRELGLPKDQCGLSGSPTRVIRAETQRAGLRHVTMLTPDSRGYESLADILRQVVP